MPTFTTEMYESNGVHDIELIDGRTLHIVSQPSWEDWIIDAQDLTPEPGDIVLSPELITSTYQLDLVAGKRDEIKSRVTQVSEQSKNNPGSVYLLGTPCLIAQKNCHLIV